jgi:2-dehydro-3-deoxyphosphogluconate aldolase/(4S)-4-hydroxy-2-oxoglutarate aldolase
MARVAEIGLLPVVELPDLKLAEPLFEALSAGGLPAAEITLRTAAGLDGIRLLVEAFPTGFIGAGTVRSVEDAARVIDAGARFVVCPGTDPELVAYCCERQVLVMPGVCTPSEIQAALRAGAAPQLKFVPTGGINAANLETYLSLPQVAACGGSWMVTKALLAERDFVKIRDLTAQAVGIVAASAVSRG